MTFDELVEEAKRLYFEQGGHEDNWLGDGVSSFPSISDMGVSDICSDLASCHYMDVAKELKIRFPDHKVEGGIPFYATTAPMYGWDDFSRQELEDGCPPGTYCEAMIQDLLESAVTEALQDTL